MKKVLVIVLALAMVLGLAACGTPANTSNNAAPAGNNAAANNAAANNNAAEVKPNKDYVIRLYSNSNDTPRVEWFTKYAADHGFKISLDDSTVYKGDDKAVQMANEKKDGDILFGLNETRWGQVIKGTYENVKLVDWTPT